jgi:hypothetical protein
MPTRPHPATGATLRRQRGAAALLMIITLVVILTIVLAPRLTLWQVRNSATDRGYQTLINARAAILAHAGSPAADPPPSDPANPTRKVGQISLTPDLPASAGTTFTGVSRPAPDGNPGCATNSWVPGQALVDPGSPYTLTTSRSVRCFGRVPWLSYGLEGPSTSDDEGGTVPWMFISANLVGVACVTNFDKSMVGLGYTTGGCKSRVPFPWLRVVDDRGNVLSAEVAIVLILPGSPVTNAQRRTVPNDRFPAAYVDALTVTAACPRPCVPGTYNNANYTVAAGLPWTFVIAPPSTALGPPPSYYGKPFTFNDRLIYITASEYFQAMAGHR